MITETVTRYAELAESIQSNAAWSVEQPAQSHNTVRALKVQGAVWADVQGNAGGWFWSVWVGMQPARLVAKCANNKPEVSAARAVELAEQEITRLANTKS